ncbi:Surface antigen variable number repeat-containing protein [Rhodothermus profundi]|uniref:Surface antigen variable number repeat-containing protein n=1 Tax=Rhodothermus profundi TaxID=633813 RepID=A0A1M6SYJ1_9BACT|nr:Surface antigen variable number repeat-containing protein [Rhodothermus profundi]
MLVGFGPNRLLFAQPISADTLRLSANFRLGTIHILESAPLPADVVRAALPFRPGDPLTTERLQAGLATIARLYARAGYPLARVIIRQLDLDPAHPDRLLLTLTVEPGPRLYLDRILLQGTRRTQPAFVARLLHLRPGQWLRPFDPERMAERLAASGLFRRVDPPLLYLTGDTTAALVFSLEEAPPGSFNLLLGYQPAGNGRGGLVGSGHLWLRHLFGAGRELELQLERLPGRISRFRLEAADPFLLSTAFLIRFSFIGRQQDSTYNRQDVRLTLGYQFPSGLQITSSWRQEITRPGPAGLRLAGSQQRIARGNATLLGFGLRWQQLDHPVAPRRGLMLTIQAERGRKTRSTRQLAGLDTIRVQTRTRQDRLEATLRFYHPLTGRLVLVGGGELALLRASQYDAADLYRLGGARSLRGYNEEQFVGVRTARVLAEVRYLLTLPTFIFAFLDVGYVATAPRPDRPIRTTWHPGYGLGVQVETGAGLLNLSYALNPNEPMLDGRLHLQLMLAL